MRGLLEGGYPIDGGPYGYSGFWLAAAYGKLDAAKFLFDHGANMHLRGSRERLLPIEVASYMGYSELVQWLLDSGAFPRKALHFAAKGGNLGIIEWVLKKEPKQEALSPFINSPACICCGWTPLSLAIAFHQLAVSRVLASALLASEGSREDLAKALPPRVCELCRVDFGSTVLHLLAAQGGCCEDLVALLLREFPLLNTMKDDLNQTPFDVAAPKLKPKFNEAFLGCLKSVRQSLLSTPGRIPLDQLQRHVTEKWAEASKSDDDWAKVATILHKSNDLCSAAAKELKKDIAFPDLKHIEKELLIDTGIQVWCQECSSEEISAAKEDLMTQAQDAEKRIRKVLTCDLGHDPEQAAAQQGGKLEFSFEDSSNISCQGCACFATDDARSLSGKASNIEQLKGTMDILTVVLIWTIAFP